MKRNENVRLYNILLPLWLLLFWPSALWLVLIPANYLIDRFVLRWSLGEMPEKGAFCRRHTWKICLAGFAGDLAGACILFGVFMCSAVFTEDAPFRELMDKIEYGVGFNPFSHIGAFLVTALSVAASAGLLYLIDRKILRKAGLSAEQAKKSALRLALITAPYLYFFPSELLYGGL